VFKWTSVALLILMALGTCLWPIKWIIVPVYLLRTMTANCTVALSRSVLMDFVPKVRLILFSEQKLKTSVFKNTFSHCTGHSVSAALSFMIIT
jgi:hypothetical protein